MNQPEVIVAGHICLDVTPQFLENTGAGATWLQPGKLVEVGPAAISTGGVVSNTGLALHKLGVPTRLMGKVGDDLIGGTILEFVRGIDPALAAGMIVVPGEASSYSVVISPPGVDRMFLHCPGANNTFGAADVPYATLAGARLFHFGYPPLMRRMYADGGRELAAMFRQVKERGLTTSLDMVMPDPQTEAGRVDWPALLQRVLPFVDIFLPSLDEMQVMFGAAAVDRRALAGRLQSWGPRIVGFKLGDQGLYVRWDDREWTAPCFAVDVVGTNGAGDATIAGFLAGWLRGLPPDEVMTMAVAVGACCCEAPDATSGVQPWEAIRARIRAGWPRRTNRGES